MASDHSLNQRNKFFPTIRDSSDQLEIKFYARYFSSVSLPSLPLQIEMMPGTIFTLSWLEKSEISGHMKTRPVPVGMLMNHFRPNGPCHVTNGIMEEFRITLAS